MLSSESIRAIAIIESSEGENKRGIISAEGGSLHRGRSEAGKLKGNRKITRDLLASLR
jgi:hypothetical protein